VLPPSIASHLTTSQLHVRPPCQVGSCEVSETSHAVCQLLAAGQSAHKPLLEAVALINLPCCLPTCRMRPAISSWPSTQFYAARLLDGHNVRSSSYGAAQVALQPDLPPHYGAAQVALQPDLPPHYAFIDTSLSPSSSQQGSSSKAGGGSGGAKGGRGKQGGGKGSSGSAIVSYAEEKLQPAGCRNPGEAALVQRLLLRLQACCRPGTSVGVITPYNAQVGRGQARAELFVLSWGWACYHHHMWLGGLTQAWPVTPSRCIGLDV
jgi:hypothetical protein